MKSRNFGRHKNRVIIGIPSWLAALVVVGAVGVGTTTSFGGCLATTTTRTRAAVLYKAFTLQLLTAVSLYSIADLLYSTETIECTLGKWWYYSTTTTAISNKDVG